MTEVEAEEWRKYIAELRQVAARAADAERQRRLFDLAERWTQFADGLSEADHDRDQADRVTHAAEQPR